MNGEQLISHDDAADVLYAKLPDAVIETSSTVEGDDFVVLNYDRDGHVVGLQLIEAHEMQPTRWSEFFGDLGIPKALFEATLEWLSAEFGRSPSHI